MADKTNETVIAEKVESTQTRKSNSRAGGRSGSSRSAANRNNSASRSGNRNTGAARGGNRNSGGRGRGANTNANKVLKQSPIAIACYVFAALMLLYACYNVGSTVRQINEYIEAYQQTPPVNDCIMLIIQAGFDPLVQAITFFMAGYILNAVRKLDPNNYVAKKKKENKAKKEDKTVEFNKKPDKTENKTEKTAELTKTETATEIKSAKEEFEESLKAELKKDEENTAVL